MVTGACLTLALINLRLGLAGVQRAAHLCFSLSAFSVAFISGVELALMHADNPARYAAVLVWGDLATGAILASLTAFIWVFFGTGNKCGSRWRARPVCRGVAVLPGPRDGSGLSGDHTYQNDGDVWRDLSGGRGGAEPVECDQLRGGIAGARLSSWMPRFACGGGASPAGRPSSAAASCSFSSRPASTRR